MNDDNRLSEALAILKSHGLHLPPDTSIGNLVERICVAGYGRRMGKVGKKPGKAGQSHQAYGMRRTARASGVPERGVVVPGDDGPNGLR